MEIRLNKFLTLCGVASRRKSEEYIKAGRIKLNGKVIKKLATTVNSETDILELDNKKLQPVKEFKYLMLYKPKGYITTTSDERGRAIVMDMIPHKYRRLGVYPVGRLDKDTEGLLLLTNDGELAQRLTKPQFHVTKEYFVELDKPISEKEVHRMEKGFYLHQLKITTKPCKIFINNKSQQFVTVILEEGKKRQIRYMFHTFGYKIKKLMRTQYGPLSLGRLHKGAHRELRKKEVTILKALVSK